MINYTNSLTFNGSFSLEVRWIRMGNILGKLAGNFERKSKLIDIPSFDVSPPLFGDESLLPIPPILIEINSN